MITNPTTNLTGNLTLPVLYRNLPVEGDSQSLSGRNIDMLNIVRSERLLLFPTKKFRFLKSTG